MTEADWLSCSDPGPMLEFLRNTGKASDRKLRLFACACARRVWHLLGGPPRNFVEMAGGIIEQVAEGAADVRELVTARGIGEEIAGDTGWAGWAACAAWSLARAAQNDVWAAARGAAESAARAAGEDASCAARVAASNAPDADWLAASEAGKASGMAAERVEQASLLRDICSPFRLTAANPSGLTPGVVLLARDTYDDRMPSGEFAPARLLGLAWALEDAGCRDAELLVHLRSPGPHVRGCVGIDAVLGKSYRRAWAAVNFSCRASVLTMEHPGVEQSLAESAMRGRMAPEEYEAVAHRRFFFQLTWEKLNGTLDEVIENATPPLQGLGRAFKQNVVGATATLSMPFYLTIASVQRRRFQALHTAERIRAKAHLQSDGTVPAWAEQEALRIARERLNEEWEDQTVRDRTAEQVLHELGSSLDDEEMSVAAAELLRQGIILTWGSLEVFIRDFFVAIVNSRPDYGRRLVESEQTRHLFQLKNVPFTVLAEYGFNVQSRLGELLAGQYDLDSVPSMKAVFNVLFPANSGLRAALDARLLWVFAQRRNLIVHRRSLVDRCGPTDHR